MEFYEFYTLVREIAVAYIPSGNDVFLEVYVRNLRSVLLLSLGLGLAVYALLLILGGLGLRKMAAHEGKKHRWMGFVPILNTWYAGYIAGESNFFGQKMKRAGLYAALTEGVGVLFSVFSVLSDFLIVRYPKLETGIGLMQEPQQYVTYNVARLPAWLRPLYGETAQIWLSVIELVIGLLQIVFLYVLFLALFRKYYARSPILFTFLCAVLPVRGIVLFAVRNNKPVDYDAYIRRRMEEAARRTYGPMGPFGGGPGNGPYNGPYGGQGGPYGGNPGNGPYGGQGNNPSGQGDPFSDFGGGQNGAGTGNGGEKNAPDDGPFSGF